MSQTCGLTNHTATPGGSSAETTKLGLRWNVQRTPTITNTTLCHNNQIVLLFQHILDDSGILQLLLPFKLGSFPIEIGPVKNITTNKTTSFV